MITCTQLAMAYLGRAGINTLAAVMGVTDVDPFILGITQTAGAATPLKLGAEAVLIAAASNNFVKGIYAYAFADRKTGRRASVFSRRSRYSVFSLCFGFRGVPKFVLSPEPRGRAALQLGYSRGTHAFKGTASAGGMAASSQLLHVNRFRAVSG